MSKLRIVCNNAISRATLTASSTAGTLAPSNLQADKKSSVWRATATSARLTALWPTAETIGAVALPFCNLSPTATMRVRVTNETSITNLFACSQQMDVSSAWVQTAVTIAPNATAAPDGTLTADKIVATTANAAHYIGQAVPTQAANTTVTFSLFVKAGEYDLIDINLAVGQNRDTVFDLSNGTIPIKDATVTASIVSYGSGWYRCTVSAVVQAVSGPVFLIPYKRGEGINYAGTGASGLYVWGAQLEVGAAASSYFATTNAASIRPLGYIDSWQSYGYDSGALLACPAPALLPRGWTAAQAASAYANGGGACARHWLPAAKPAVGLAIDIVDTNNLQGYVEAACFVAGPYWSPTYNASAAPTSTVDTTDFYRTDAGDQAAEAGTIHRKVSLELRLLPPADRTAYTAIMRNSRAYPILVSVFPGSADLELERDYTIYGRRTRDAEIAIAFASAYSTTDEIEEI